MKINSCQILILSVNKTPSTFSVSKISRDLGCLKNKNLWRILIYSSTSGVFTAGTCLSVLVWWEQHVAESNSHGLNALCDHCFQLF